MARSMNITTSPDTSDSAGSVHASPADHHTAVYEVGLTGAQRFGFSDLVRRSGHLGSVLNGWFVAALGFAAGCGR